MPEQKALSEMTELKKCLRKLDQTEEGYYKVSSLPELATVLRKLQEPGRAECRNRRNGKSDKIKRTRAVIEKNHRPGFVMGYPSKKKEPGQRGTILESLPTWKPLPVLLKESWIARCVKSHC